MSYLIIQELQIGFYVHLDPLYNYESELAAIKRIFSEEAYIPTDDDISDLSMQDYIDIGRNIDCVNWICTTSYSDELALLFFFQNRGLTWELFSENNIPDKYLGYIQN